MSVSWWLPHPRIASSLSPEDPEIAFNHAAVLEASSWISHFNLYIYSGHVAAGRLEEALEEYKRSKNFGVERAAVHIRNVCASSTLLSLFLLTTEFQVGAKILGKKMKEVQNTQKSED